MNALSHSIYNVLYLKVQQRFSRGLTFISSFAWASLLDDPAFIGAVAERV